VKAHNTTVGTSWLTNWRKKRPAEVKQKFAHTKIPKSAVIRELKGEGEQEWKSEWDASTKGAITKYFFPIIRDRLSKRLQIGLKQSTI